MKIWLAVSYLASGLLLPALTIEHDAAGVTIHNSAETVRVTVCGPSVIHVVAGPGEPPSGLPHEAWLTESSPVRLRP